jgi:hypothetical protein
MSDQYGDRAFASTTRAAATFRQVCAPSSTSYRSGVAISEEAECGLRSEPGARPVVESGHPCWEDAPFSDRPR